MKSNDSVSWKSIIILSGALCAYLIGAATATGQESMQFYASHGFLGVGGVVITLILFAWASSSIIAAGHDTKEMNQSVYKYYFGRLLGTLFEWIVIIFLFMLVVTMVSAAGSVFSEYFEVSKYIGSALMALAVFLTVLLSLNRLIDLLGLLGPMMIIITIIISVISIFNHFDGMTQSSQLVHELDVPKAIDSWWLSGVLYASFGITTAAPFLMRMGSTANKRREGLLGGLTGAVVYAIATITITIALIANISFTYNKETPIVFLAEQLHPLLGMLFSVIILTGIYTTASPMLWYICDRTAFEGTKGHKILAAILTVLAFLGGLFLPFGTLVGTLYPLIGVLGMLLFVAIGVKQIRSLRKKPHQPEKEQVVKLS